MGKVYVKGLRVQLGRQKFGYVCCSPHTVLDDGVSEYLLPLRKAGLTLPLRLGVASKRL